MNSWRLSKHLILVAGAALWACGTAVAQMQQQPGGGQMQQTPQTSVPGQAGATNPTANMPGMENNNSNMPSYADQSFLRKTLEDDEAQVQMGQLAAQKSSSADVKQFGEKMVQIHQQLSQQIEPVAKKLDVDTPKGPSKKDRQEIEKMQALSGPDFDTAFIKAMLKDQQSDLKEFKDEAHGAQNPGVQQLAKMDTPVLSQHLQILEQLAQAHNVTVESKK
jgi:putative membrane protein